MATALSGLTVLVVDNNSQTSRSIRTLLDTVGTRHVEICSDGQSGFAAFCTVRHDLIFIDYGATQPAGIELLDLIRTSPHSPNPYVPVIMVSADSDEERVQMARDHGASDFLAKPFTADTIVRRMQAVIDDPRPFVRTSTYFGPDRRESSPTKHAGPERRRIDIGIVHAAK